GRQGATGRGGMTRSFDRDRVVDVPGSDDEGVRLPWRARRVSLWRCHGFLPLGEAVCPRGHRRSDKSMSATAGDGSAEGSGGAAGCVALARSSGPLAAAPHPAHRSMSPTGSTSGCCAAHLAATAFSGERTLNAWNWIIWPILMTMSTI